MDKGFTKISNLKIIEQIYCRTNIQMRQLLDMLNFKIQYITHKNINDKPRIAVNLKGRNNNSFGIVTSLVSIINDPPVIILASAFLQGYIPVSSAYLLGLQVADEE